MLADQIIAYEAGELDSDDILALFSQLIKTGMINHLQGSYGRTAYWFVSAGLLNWKGEVLKGQGLE